MKDDEHSIEGEEIYSDEGREEMVENDEIEPWEEGFMEGAEQGGQNAKCRKCGKVLVNRDMVEREIKGAVCWFCSEDCADKYEEERS
ncbi:MAG TPA: hypothetical protein VJC16_03710 [Candidatus Nanoarchaeia archaeon]|nr:hypothetical protein [Candidatus Nanoarchaeia archaeon]